MCFIIVFFHSRFFSGVFFLSVQNVYLYTLIPNRPIYNKWPNCIDAKIVDNLCSALDKCA